MKSKLFTPVTFGPLTLRNRTIRSAAFESMCPGNAPSQMLLDYHRSVAAGGVGMTTVDYSMNYDANVFKAKANIKAHRIWLVFSLLLTANYGYDLP